MSSDLARIDLGAEPSPGRGSCRSIVSAARPLATGCAQPIVLVAVLLAAFWPVWRWYVARMSDGSDDPLGVFALLTAAAFLPRTGWRTPVAPGAALGATLCLAAYVAGFDHLPALGRAILAVLAIALVLPRDPVRPFLPRAALLLLSLPVIATLQFYLGYPLRAATTWCAAGVLTLGGLPVSAHGTVLAWAGEEILVDAPCSGIRMLWTTSYLSATLALLHRLPTRAFLRLAQVTAGAVFVANLTRTLVLFQFETGRWPNPPWAHEGAGLALFIVAATLCAWTARRLRRATSAASQRA